MKNTWEYTIFDIKTKETTYIIGIDITKEIDALTKMKK